MASSFVEGCAEGGAVGDGNTWERSREASDFDAVLTATDAAGFLKLSPRTLEKWRVEARQWRSLRVTNDEIAIVVLGADIARAIDIIPN